MKIVDKLKKFVQGFCTDKIRVCTPRFCATGCVDHEFDDDYMLAMKNVEVTYPEDNHRKEHIDRMVICDDYIISFEPIRNNGEEPP